jgi:hypothetical protein
MNEAKFRIDYLDDNLAVILSETTASADDWAACEYGWNNMPEDATDFRVTALDAD